MNSQEYTIKTMSLDDLKLASNWAELEGWNPGKFDAECYYRADPNGFLMGYLGDEPIASISVVNYGNEFGFLGFYIVKPEYRGKGFGYKLWQAGMNYLSGINVGLDGVVAQQDNYKKSGFKFAYQNIRFEGSVVAPKSISGEVCDLIDVAFDKVAQFETAFFPVERKEFLKNWIEHPEHIAFGYLIEGKLKGYAVARYCEKGVKVGPLFADKIEYAQALFDAVQSRLREGDTIYLDVPAINEQALALVDNYAMKPCFETARMYTGNIPKLDVRRIFGITSFEIG
ncbi:GNAT family N-acetyltransferase (plasmid) [Pseudoalteromonas xiamenensis]|uniref:GNAT family N-acetyltransferase n=2 Tax=Pseudoalteromonas xiamenensis TaxID=882626 RepID=UPI0027E54D7B|nr:GNAT family N-acetyltransferase [Pseudoalteromonas xiamenensis]WMN62244.1 GNAT family N-acetyltransferase [Pseudoalteromonas xiamenensis]